MINFSSFPLWLQVILFRLPASGSSYLSVPNTFPFVYKCLNKMDFSDSNEIIAHQLLDPKILHESSFPNV